MCIISLFFLSYHHFSKRAWSKLLPSSHQTPPPYNFHLVLPPHLHHRLLFDDESPHQNVVVERLPPKKPPATFPANSRASKMNSLILCGIIIGWKRLGSWIAMAPPWWVSLSLENFIIRRNWCTKTYSCE